MCTFAFRILDNSWRGWHHLPLLMEDLHVWPPRLRCLPWYDHGFIFLDQLQILTKLVKGGMTEYRRNGCLSAACSRSCDEHERPTRSLPLPPGDIARASGCTTARGRCAQLQAVPPPEGCGARARRVLSWPLVGPRQFQSRRARAYGRARRGRRRRGSAAAALHGSRARRLMAVAEIHTREAVR